MPTSKRAIKKYHATGAAMLHPGMKMMVKKGVKGSMSKKQGTHEVFNRK